MQVTPKAALTIQSQAHPYSVFPAASLGEAGRGRERGRATSFIWPTGRSGPSTPPISRPSPKIRPARTGWKRPKSRNLTSGSRLSSNGCSGAASARTRS